MIRSAGLCFITTALLCLSALYVRSYWVSDSLSWERTGELPLYTTSVGAQAYRGQLLFFRTGVFRGRPGAPKRAWLRYGSNDPRYFDPLLERTFQIIFDFGGIAFFKLDRPVGRIPAVERFLRIPIPLPAILLAVPLAFAIRKRIC